MQPYDNPYVESMYEVCMYRQKERVFSEYKKDVAQVMCLSKQGFKLISYT
jgi:hypothetical protein